MIALREKQKAERHRRIIEAATELFGEVGYDLANMEMLAERAEVSIGTIYNYYKNKGDLLLSIIATEARQTYEIGRSIIDGANDSPKETILQLIDTYVGEPMKFMNKDTWRRAIAMSILQPDSQFGQQYAQVDSQLRTQLIELVLTLVKRGHFKGASDPSSLGEVLFNNVNMEFTLFMIDDSATLDELKQKLTCQTLAVLDGF
jgi:AcrR family transcriptional regulator